MSGLNAGDQVVVATVTRNVPTTTTTGGGGLLAPVAAAVAGCRPYPSAGG